MGSGTRFPPVRTSARYGPVRTWYPERPTDAGFPLPPGAPLFWYSAQNTDGLLNTTRTDATTFQTWKNLGSAASADAAQGNAALRGKFYTVASAGKLNNLSGVRFDGTDDYFHTGAFVDPDPVQPIIYCIIFMTTTVAGGSAQVLLAGDTDSVNSHQTWLNENHVAMYANTHVTNVGLDVTANAYHMLLATYNGASSSARVNGVASGTISVGTAPQGAMYLMAKGGGAFPVAGDLIECVAWNDGTTAAQIEAWAEAAYGAFEVGGQ